jgi:hypothetical protein
VVTMFRTYNIISGYKRFVLLYLTLPEVAAQGPIWLFSAVPLCRAFKVRRSGTV